MHIRLVTHAGQLKPAGIFAELLNPDGVSSEALIEMRAAMGPIPGLHAHLYHDNVEGPAVALELTGGHLALCVLADTAEERKRIQRRALVFWLPTLLDIAPEASPDTDEMIDAAVEEAEKATVLVAALTAALDGHDLPIASPAWDASEIVGEVQIGAACLRTYDEMSHHIAVSVADLARTIRS